LGGLAAAAVLVSAVGPAAAAEPTFPTAQAAMAAFKTAIASDDPAGLLALFGNEHEDELLGGDPASRREEIASMASGAQEALALDSQDADHATILIGREAWPMPVPLVKDGDAWHFDTEAGLEEIIDRRIGRNELSAIALLRDYVDAQVEYASQDRDGDGVLQYAQRVTSSPGKHDGLYWPTVVGEPASPFGPLVAEAEEHLRFHKKGEPYQGYFFRILTRQGKNVPGGAYDYVINGNMIAGFAMVAWPADYGNSGVMTFVISHQGKLYQKDLGPGTAGIAADMKAYDPGSTWTLVAATQ
jgi:hypothetical protein